jgi:translation initiation factor IF-2
LAGGVRIFQLAKKLGLRSETLIAVLAELGVEDVTAASSIDVETARAAAELLVEQAKSAVAAREEAEAEEQAKADAEAEAAKEAAAEAAKAAEADKPAVETAPVAADAPARIEDEDEGEEDEDEDEEPRWMPQWADPSTLRTLEEQLAELEREVATVEDDTLTPLPELARRPSGDRPDRAIDVPPVVAVLGHVDHGKTTLLDSLRDTDVVSGEAGGITQHIGASEITVGDRSIVFVDTPGHAAFTAMRARGGQVADIVILIVAADDGIMPQTIEAIGHARAANVPMIVAINKVDMPGADVERVKQQLLEHEMVPEEWGGDTIVVPISALEKQGLDDLLEMIGLVAEVQELWADPEAEFAGIVVEAGIDESRGPVSTILVRNGEIKVGDVVVCGTAHGRIRRLNDWRGKSVKSMGPGHPVEVIGLSEPVEAGDIMTAVSNIKEARQITAERVEELRQADTAGTARVSLRDLQVSLGELSVKDLNLVIKGDVWGSIQALEQSLMNLDDQLEEVDIVIVHSAVGEVTESDVLLAVASDAIILAFHTSVTEPAVRMADDEGVEIRRFDIIYQCLEDIQAAMAGMLDPVFEQKVVGHAQVRQVFRISRFGVIAGCGVTDGYVERGANMTVTRAREVVFEGKVTSLRHFNDTVARVDSPNECGLNNRDFRGWEEGDQIEFSAEVEIPRARIFNNTA